MNTTQKKLIEFFATHPNDNVVYVALGNLFTDLEKATKYCAGTKASPETYSREQVIVPEVEGGNGQSAMGNEENPEQSENSNEQSEIIENPATVTAGDSQPGTTTEGGESSLNAADGSDNSNQSSPQDAGIEGGGNGQSAMGNEELQTEQPEISEEVSQQIQLVEDLMLEVQGATKKKDKQAAQKKLDEAKQKLAEMQGIQ